MRKEAVLFDSLIFLYELLFHSLWSSLFSCNPNQSPRFHRFYSCFSYFNFQLGWQINFCLLEFFFIFPQFQMAHWSGQPIASFTFVGSQKKIFFFPIQFLIHTISEYIYIFYIISFNFTRVTYCHMYTCGWDWLVNAHCQWNCYQCTRPNEYELFGCGPFKRSGKSHNKYNK